MAERTDRLDTAALLKMLGPFLLIIAAVWLLRLLLAEVDAVPRGLLRFLSVSAVTPLCVVVAASIIHFRRLGGFTAVVITAFVLVAWAEILVSLAVLATWVTGWVNVYSHPRFSPKPSVDYWRHILGHLTFGIGFGALFGGLIGGVVLVLLRWIAPISRE
ncbi:MAG: hypothetical protein Kow00109_05620 [Acidobacteriota bacterium]